MYLALSEERLIETRSHHHARSQAFSRMIMQLFFRVCKSGRARGITPKMGMRWSELKPVEERRLGRAAFGGLWEPATGSRLLATARRPGGPAGKGGEWFLRGGEGGR